MSDFAVWLKNLDPGQDAELIALKDFAQSNASVWPFGSNEIREYVSVVSTNLTDAATRSTLLSALTEAFVQWKLANRAAPAGFWSRLTTGIGARLGPYLLALFGLLIAAVLIYGIFYGDFLSTMAKADQARGLITFLFSISTIAIFLLIAIATFWIDKAQVEERFDKAKDLLTLMIGIFGTILGFYYGSLANTTNEPSQTLTPGNLGASNVIVAPHEKTPIAESTGGGSLPMKYDLYLVDPRETVNADGLSVKDESANSGANVETVMGPVSVARPTSLSFTLVVSYAKGTQTNGTALFIVKPQADGGGGVTGGIRVGAGARRPHSGAQGF